MTSCGGCAAKLQTVMNITLIADVEQWNTLDIFIMACLAAQTTAPSVTMISDHELSGSTRLNTDMIVTHLQRQRQTHGHPVVSGRPLTECTAWTNIHAHWWRRHADAAVSYHSSSKLSRGNGTAEWILLSLSDDAMQQWGCSDIRLSPQMHVCFGGKYIQSRVAEQLLSITHPTQ